MSLYFLFARQNVRIMKKNVCCNKKENLLTLIICFLLFISISILVPAGALSPSTDIECSANYYADIIESAGNDVLLPFIVQPKKNSDNPISTKLEFFRLYGSYGENNITFVGAVNTMKDNKITSLDLDCNKNYSFIFYDNEEINSIENEGKWRHAYYPLLLMFKDYVVQGKNQQSIYISNSDADILLEKSNLEKNAINYKSLLGKMITIKYNESIIESYISNIYLETNYFFTEIYRTLGNFFVCANDYSKDFTYQSVYFLNKYSYQNKHLLKHIASQYDENKFDFFVHFPNQVNNITLDESKLEFLFSKKKPLASIILITFSSVLLCLGLFLILKNKWLFENKICIVLLIVSIFLPYLISKSIYLITRNIYFFCELTSNLNCLFIIVIILLCICFFIVTKMDKNEKNLENIEK